MHLAKCVREKEHGLQALPVFFLLHFRRNRVTGEKTVAVLGNNNEKRDVKTD